MITYTDHIATAHTDTVEDDGRIYETDMLVQIQSPGNAVRLESERADHVTVTFSFSDNPGCPRRGRDVYSFDLWPEDLDRLAKTLQAAIAEARACGILAPAAQGRSSASAAESAADFANALRTGQ